jgi:translation machinery-associated protein 16
MLRVSTFTRRINGAVALTSFAVDVYGFFYHAMPDDGVLTLDEIHDLVRDLWLTRHDQDIEAEIKARRKGRHKSTKQVKLEEIKIRELELYRTGMGVSVCFCSVWL